jgi:hypothetical protein
LFEAILVANDGDHQRGDSFGISAGAAEQSDPSSNQAHIHDFFLSHEHLPPMAGLLGIRDLSLRSSL